MFEVGKEVICIKDHSEGVVKKGQRFELLGIRKGCCKGTPLDLNIGLYTRNPLVKCGYCSRIGNSDGVHWLGSALFAPIDNSLSELTTADILKEPALTTN